MKRSGQQRCRHRPGHGRCGSARCQLVAPTAKPTPGPSPCLPGCKARVTRRGDRGPIARQDWKHVLLYSTVERRSVWLQYTPRSGEGKAIASACETRNSSILFDLACESAC
jgi:hypothetical protein